jgi:hypothetical protein
MDDKRRKPRPLTRSEQIRRRRRLQHISSFLDGREHLKATMSTYKTPRPGRRRHGRKYTHMYNMSERVDIDATAKPRPHTRKITFWRTEVSPRGAYRKPNSTFLTTLIGFLGLY